MMDHNNGRPDQVKAIHTGEEMDGDREEIIASKVTADKDSTNVKATKLAARRLASVAFLPLLQRSPFL
jgi:hypothetical protein